MAISAAEGTGLPALLSQVEEALNKAQVRVELTVPYGRYEALKLIRDVGTLLSEAHGAEGTDVVALLPESELWRVKKALE